MWQRGLTERSRKVVLVAAACALLPPGLPAADDEAPDAALLARYEEALALVRGGDDATAASLLQALAGEQPELAGPLFNLARIRQRQGDEDEALKLLGQASAVCSHCGAVWNEIGVLQRQQGRFGEAAAAYAEAIRLEPAFSPAHYNLAVLRELYLQQPQLALEGYRHYLTLASGDDAVEVEKWVSDLERRTGATPVAAQAGAVP